MASSFELPKVSVCMITYNHEPYIAQAIESVLMQITDFPIELVIGEDCSTDGTRVIVCDYGERYPERIRLLLPEHNLGMMPNFVATLQACRGQYIALLEGDDYWTDPLKLQKQVDFLEAHPEYVLCHHDAIVVDEHGIKIKDSKLPDNAKRDFSGDELIKGAWVLTLTACFRNVIREFPPEMLRVLNGDTFLFSLLGHFGRSRYQGNEIAPAVYRVHPGGIWSSEVNLRKRLFSQLVTCYWLRSFYARVRKPEYAQYFANRLPLSRVFYKLESSDELEKELGDQRLLLGHYLETLDAIDEVEVIGRSLSANILAGAALGYFARGNSKRGSQLLSEAIVLDPVAWSSESALETTLIREGISIAESRGKFDITTLCSYIECLGRRPPCGAQLSRRTVSRVKSRLFAAAAFRSYLVADHRHVRLFTGLALRADPLLFLDVGMLRRALVPGIERIVELRGTGNDTSY